jgi:Tfp pilus assembly protein PilF
MSALPEKRSVDDFEKAKQFFVAGMQFLQANNLPAAEEQFTRSLEIIPNRVSTLNNLSAVKIRLQKFNEAGELAQKAISAEPASSEAWSNLGIARAGMNQDEQALLAFDRALDGGSFNATVWLHKAISLFKLGRYEEALSASDRALELDSGQYMIFYVKSMVLKELGQLDQAEQLYLRSISMRSALSPVFAAPRRPSQKADILIISHNPTKEELFRSFEILHWNCPNFPGQIARLFQDDFHFTFAIEGIAAKPSAHKQIPRPDLVLNNCTNADVLLSLVKLPDLIALVDSLGVPVLNHPRKAAQTTRDGCAQLLTGISSLRVPKTMRLSSEGKKIEELVKEIEGQFDYPFIVRTLIAQQGKGMTKVDSREDLSKALAASSVEEFFVLQFIDCRGKDEFHRKIRGTIVNGEVIISRVDFSPHWNVRGRRTDERLAFYLANMYLLDEEKRICRDPEAALGRPVFEALREVGRRVPLDMFGIDFNVDLDGALVFYEANATMNLLTTAKKEIPNPPEPEERLRQVFRRYLDSIVSHR